MALSGNTLEATVRADVYSPIWLCDSAWFSKDWLPSEKNYLRSQMEYGGPQSLELPTAAYLADIAANNIPCRFRAFEQKTPHGNRESELDNMVRITLWVRPPGLDQFTQDEDG